MTHETKNWRIPVKVAIKHGIQVSTFLTGLRFLLLLLLLLFFLSRKMIIFSQLSAETRKKEREREREENSAARIHTWIVRLFRIGNCEETNFDYTNDCSWNKIRRREIKAELASKNRLHRIVLLGSELLVYDVAFIVQIGFDLWRRFVKQSIFHLIYYHFFPSLFSLSRLFCFARMPNW